MNTSILTKLSREITRITAIRKLSISNTRKCVAGRKSSSDDTHYDIVIAGGGMVGFAMANAIGQSSRMSNHSILMLEGAPNKSWSLPEEYSNRVCALSQHTQKLFSRLGVWDEIMSMRAHPVRRMQVWEACSEAMIALQHNDMNEEVAHLVENDVIVHALKQRLPPHVKIGADGAKSKVRDALGTKYLTWEYDQIGIVATVELSEPCENTVAWQRFLPTGPVALLPLSDTKSSLVWSTTKTKAKDLLDSSEDDFIDELNRALWDENELNQSVENLHGRWMDMLEAVFPGGTGDSRQLPPSIKAIVPNSRAGFPLGLGHALHYVGPRVALIGDAAHRVHPLAGQGVNLGFGDVACLTQTLEEAVLEGGDIGDELHLFKYESERQKKNLALMASVDGLYRLYTTKLTPIVLLRSLGLSAVNAFTPLKKSIISFAEA
ncbi:ubiquinone biosynthesis protein COQ6, mitochondrial isoform X2 [Oratosquilla oratoria]|uniref:ubiquinone biosynthesis protein COQ6, mitochondrial isoform X2 n=1 Tax=Oratosquilla oratoria TaxID=337810 RepID=UPI003F76660C